MVGSGRVGVRCGRGGQFKSPSAQDMSYGKTFVQDRSYSERRVRCVHYKPVFKLIRCGQFRVVSKVVKCATWRILIKRGLVGKA